ncbi:hypothetical protein BJ944DRAFT_113477 [Cunninghamella echinulata]|nr:hypothetical protein BJ944DRAFT_113477 [Cunninghamella echinulata]
MRKFLFQSFDILYLLIFLSFFFILSLFFFILIIFGSSPFIYFIFYFNHFFFFDLSPFNTDNKQSFHNPLKIPSILILIFIYLSFLTYKINYTFYKPFT